MRKLLGRVDWPLIRKALPAATIALAFIVIGAIRIDSVIAAPLFALVAAAGLCVSVGLNTSQHPRIGPIRHLALAFSAASSVAAALSWLNSVEKSVPWYLWLLVGVLVTTGIAGLAPDEKPNERN